MQFLGDIYITCETCGGSRYNQSTLEIEYQGKNIADILNMTVREAYDFFKSSPTLKNKLETLIKVGLDYINLGQSATTLSGGEAQRIKLAAELGKTNTGHTVYILDEPTTGLHFHDLKKLLTTLTSLVDNNNTVIVIEHNLDLIKNVDHLIDMGPKGGDSGGEIIATGNPKDIAINHTTPTAIALKALYS
jgi:excinuclease ABC subunit A